MTLTIKPITQKTDVVLMGAGIMSATLGMLLKELDPDITIQVFERLDRAGTESSDAWNNAGTGHSAFCELNYTPQKEDGTIDISKAIKIATSFEQSKEFWAYLVGKGYIKPAEFITRVPHMSLVWGDENVAFLEKRHAMMKESPLFKDMAFTRDRGLMEEWAPLVMRGRKSTQSVAATRMNIGTDVNFGNLTRGMMARLEKMPGVTVHYNVEALDLDPDGKGGWDVFVRNLLSMQKGRCNARFVFIGAGGATLHLLKRAEIEERKGYGGFPVSGLWLRCLNDELIAKHHAKVYGKASVGAPPMSVPHIDTRMIDGKKQLLFGPFAGFSTKFLKNGSLLDLPKSIGPDNAIPMIFAGLHNMPLTKYLIEQVRQAPEERHAALREYVPFTKQDDWELLEAGQRVQVIKKDKKEGGILEFGTEVVVSKDGTVAALLGASPGASTSVAIMLDLIVKCFGKEGQADRWQAKLKEMVPSFGVSLAANEGQLRESRARTASVLELHV
ncbi:MAG: malate dehydrogenase (quinone) [Cyclobacteriaceae bacterium]|nr:malate dehydrogenase (quinone) [Cyclobacteriaceae bacterium]MCB0500771.1 malate dehydrogenase (quinone) [Cyclobacteriaceae bacterium]MCB9236694.1 malate dehydrogenase (quinone) [Flammeovirgaceae bacterium]MCO5272615.1 malate dehydrogenase (quinone) [Cyclobacteriaceae bacterium]MCW5901973.1 malate dehydrogenase (quinone) [Cyclobacteriaceae bacterium]